MVRLFFLRQNLRQISKRQVIAVVVLPDHEAVSIDIAVVVAIGGERIKLGSGSRNNVNVGNLRNSHK
jgi:hypothetical protein